MSLAWPNHVHHYSAQNWFHKRKPQPWATTPVTESGFVRVSSNHAAITSSVTPSEALGLLVRMREVRGHVFLPDDVEFVVGEASYLDGARVVSHRLVTDAHLLALARRHKARLVTFDGGVAAMAGGDADDVLLIPMVRF